MKACLRVRNLALAGTLVLGGLAAEGLLACQQTLSPPLANDLSTDTTIPAKAENVSTGPSLESIRRPYVFPIVFNASEDMFGYHAASIVAYVFIRGEWQRIPVQVDQKNEREEFVLDQGLPYTKDSDDGRIDENDELVLDGGMLGDSFTKHQVKDLLPPDAPYWKLRVCLQEEWIGDVLLADRVVNAAKRHPSFLKQVNFSIRDQQVDTEVYRYRFHSENPALLGGVQLKEGTQLQSVIKDSTFHLPLRTAWFLPNLEFGPGDFTAEIESWHVGPLRTIIAVGVKYQAFLSLIKLHLFSELLFYKNQFSIPTAIEFVFDPSGLLRPGSGVAYSVNFTQEFRDWQIASNLADISEHVSFTGTTSSKSKGVAHDVASPFYVDAENGDVAIAITARVAPAALGPVQVPLLLNAKAMANPKYVKVWPWLKRLDGDLGIFLDFSGVSRGTYDFGLDLMLGSKADVSHARERSIKVNWLP